MNNNMNNISLKEGNIKLNILPEHCINLVSFIYINGYK